MNWTPWRFFLAAIAGWMNRQQQEAISYLREESRILREKLGHRRILLNLAQKRRLDAAPVRLPRDLLLQVRTLFSPDTLLKWHRWLIARKYDGSAAGEYKEADGVDDPKHPRRGPRPRLEIRLTTEGEPLIVPMK